MAGEETPSGWVMVAARAIRIADDLFDGEYRAGDRSGDVFIVAAVDPQAPR